MSRARQARGYEEEGEPEPTSSSVVVSCIPASAKMSKAKKIVDEARELKNPEVDLTDKAIASFDELPGLRECNALFRK